MLCRSSVFLARSRVARSMIVPDLGVWGSTLPPRQNRTNRNRINTKTSARKMHVASAEQITRIRKDVEAKLGEHAAEIADEAYIQRYFRATGGNHANTVKRLVASGKWRQETNPTCLDCAACLKDPQSHYLHM